MSDQQINSPVNVDEYWTIVAKADYWVYSVVRLIRRHQKPDSPYDSVLYGTQDGNPVYLIKKTLIPLPEIAKWFGLDASVIMELRSITLEPTKQWKPFPAPSVGYYGEA